MTDSFNQNNVNQPRQAETVTADTTLTLDSDMVVADSSGGAITLSLPDARQIPSRTIAIKAPSGAAFAVTISGQFGQTIDGAASTALSANNQSTFVKSDGSNWQLVGQGTGGGVTTLSQAITAETAAAFTATNSINWGVADTEFLDIEDSAGATLLRVTGNVAGSTSTVLIGADSDLFDVNAIVNNFENGISVDTGAASTTINAGVTPNQIDSGGAITVTSADGSAATFRSADVAAAGNAGAVAVTAGDGGTALGNLPGAVTITSGTAGTGSSASGANINLQTGPGDGTAVSGSILATAADANAAGGLGGSFTAQAGNNPFLANGSGGSVNLRAGTGQGATFSGGEVDVLAGAGTSGGLGGDVNIIGGNSDASGETLAGTGTVVIRAGNNGGTDRAGDVLINSGIATSTGDAGRIVLEAGTASTGVDGFIQFLTTRSGTTDNAVVQIDTQSGSFAGSGWNHMTVGAALAGATPLTTILTVNGPTTDGQNLKLRVWGTANLQTTTADMMSQIIEQSFVRSGGSTTAVTVNRNDRQTNGTIAVGVAVTLAVSGSDILIQVLADTVEATNFMLEVDWQTGGMGA